LERLFSHREQALLFYTGGVDENSEPNFDRAVDFCFVGVCHAA
jgi:hypothetical protein